jgi:hypothetical protein
MPAEPPIIRDVADLTSIIRELLDPTPVITGPVADLDHGPSIPPDPW